MFFFEAVWVREGRYSRFGIESCDIDLARLGAEQRSPESRGAAVECAHDSRRAFPLSSTSLDRACSDARRDTEGETGRMYIVRTVIV